MWKKLNVNSNMVQADAPNALLIGMPNKSEYAGYSFWISKKLVRSGKHPAALEISYKDDFIFHLLKYGNGRFNSREIIDDIPLAADEMEEALSTVNENITGAKSVNIYETHKPPELDAVDTVADESLID